MVVASTPWMTKRRALRRLGRGAGTDGLRADGRSGCRTRRHHAASHHRHHHTTVTSLHRHASLRPQGRDASMMRRRESGGRSCKWRKTSSLGCQGADGPHILERTHPRRETDLMSQAHGPGTGGDRSPPTDMMLRWATKVPCRLDARRTPRGPGPRGVMALLVSWVSASCSRRRVRLLDEARPLLFSRVALPPRATDSRHGGANGRADPGRRDPGVHVQVPRARTAPSTWSSRSGSWVLHRPPGRPARDEGYASAVRSDRRSGSPPRGPVRRQPAPPAGGPLSTGGRVLLPNAPLAVELRYRLEGAATVSTPSTPGARSSCCRRSPPTTASAAAGGRRGRAGPESATWSAPGLDAGRTALRAQGSPRGGGPPSLPPRATAVLAQLDLTSY